MIDMAVIWMRMADWAKAENPLIQQQPQQQAPTAPRPKAQQPPGEAKQPAPQRKAPPRANNDWIPRPPLNIFR